MKNKSFIKSLRVLLILLIFSYTALGCSGKPLFHFHDFKPAYEENAHFMYCSCGEKRDVEKHSYEWESDFLHKKCTECGYKVNNVFSYEIERNEDFTIKLSEDMLYTLSEYLKQYTMSYDIPSNSLEQKLKFCSSSEYNPILVKFSDRCYYVAAYFTQNHENAEYENSDFCCVDKYTWVGYEKADEIKEYVDGQRLVVAFQINTPELCVNLKEDFTDQIIEHFVLYIPKFENGKATSPEIKFDSLFIYLDKGGNKNIYYSSEAVYHEPWTIDCVEYEGEYYVMEYCRRDNSEGGYDESYLAWNYGEYYDTLVNISHKIDSIKGENYVYFKVRDILALIK